MLLILTETRKEGLYSTGDILFTSETNNVNVRFTSDYTITRSGFTLDVQSISCADRPQYPQQGDNDHHTTSAYPDFTDGNPNYSENNGGCDVSVQQIELAARQFLQDALVSDTGSDGLYSNNACQNWHIITDENKVNYASMKTTLLSWVSMWQVVVTNPI